MKNTIKTLAVAVPLALGLSISSANAAIYNAGTITAGSFETNTFGITNVKTTNPLNKDSTDFYDSLEFVLTGTFDVDIFADFTPKGFSFSRIDLLKDGGWIAEEDGSAPYSIFKNLEAGNYQVNFKYNFATADEYVGSTYRGGVSIAAVPEPETYAMMLAGLGLIGFATRRRYA